MTGYDPLGEQHLAQSADRYARGQFYTPEPLVRTLWSLIDTVSDRPRTVLDPACGTGRLLRPAAERGSRTIGLDVDEGALAIARRSLPDADLRRVDALSPDAELDPVDVLVANPPYGRRVPDAHIRDVVAPFAFPERWFDEVPPDERNRGKLVEHAAWFVASADRRVRPGGTIALLTTNTWLTIPTWRFLRRWLLHRWTFRYVVDFNRPSDRRSVFLPDAAIGACVVVATKAPPSADHRVRMLDLSDLPTVAARYEAIGSCAWRPPARDVRDLVSFAPHPPEALPWSDVPQAELRGAPDHRIRRPTAIARRVERSAVKLSELAPTHPGVDPGDLRHLVGRDEADLRRKLAPILAGELDGLTPTARAHLERSVPLGPFDPTKVVPFVFQKDLIRWGWRAEHVTYLDRRVLWRARLHDAERSPILATPKLLVLERRERGEVIAVVADRRVVPQHGGRLLYVTGLDADVLHALAAILNSPVYQVYFREAAQGDKDLRVPDVRRLPDDLVQRLALASRARHRGGSDRDDVGTMVTQALSR